MIPVISAAELKTIMDIPEVKILDASYGLPPTPIRIGNAIDFNIDDVADPKAALPHTLPSAEVFSAKVSALGISNPMRVIIYDRSGMAMAAARAWWMFRIFGHNQVQVLDGGLPGWMKAGLPVTQQAKVTPKPATYRAMYNPALFKSRQQMVDNLKSKAFTVLDARDAKRYAGDAPEPRPGVQSGHIPGSLNVPFLSLIDPASGLLKSDAKLEEIFKNIDRSKPLAISCGSGVTACVVALGLYQLGKQDAAIYGGSWTEWGSDATLPKTKGTAP